MLHAMLDLETFGNGVDAAIVQIGACHFNPLTGEIKSTLKINVHGQSCLDSGAVIDADTMYWWLAQSDEARKSILNDPKTEITPACYELNEFLRSIDDIWSHATFDFVIVKQTMRRLKIKPSFSYRAARDIRTLISMSGINTQNFERKGTHHDALEDAIHQVSYCVAAMGVLRNRIQSNA